MEEVFINFTTEPSELTQYWGNRFFEDTNSFLCIRTQEKEVVTPQETDPDLPMSIQESLMKAWVEGGLLQDSRH